jgi:hypothetical protein
MCSLFLTFHGLSQRELNDIVDLNDKQKLRIMVLEEVSSMRDDSMLNLFVFPTLCGHPSG